MEKVWLYLGGMELQGFVHRDIDLPRTQHNTWNGWECPSMDLGQLQFWIAVQNQWIKWGNEIDLLELVPRPEKGSDELWLKITNSECPEDPPYYIRPNADGLYDVSNGYCWELDTSKGHDGRVA